jgi:hypothetical protein
VHAQLKGIMKTIGIAPYGSGWTLVDALAQE